LYGGKPVEACGWGNSANLLNIRSKPTANGAKLLTSKLFENLVMILSPIKQD